MYLDYNQIASDCKQRLQAMIGRTVILGHEWIRLKRLGFPFNAPYQYSFLLALTMPIEIRCCDSTPLVNLLKQRFGQERDVDQTEINHIKDYAWSYILDSVRYVWGG